MVKEVNYSNIWYVFMSQYDALMQHWSFCMAMASFMHHDDQGHKSLYGPLKVRGETMWFTYHSGVHRSRQDSLQSHHIAMSEGCTYHLVHM